VVNITKKSFHDAGYDAYCCGVAAALMAHHLVNKEEAQPLSHQIKKNLFEPYLNCLNVPQASFPAFALYHNGCFLNSHLKKKKKKKTKPNQTRDSSRSFPSFPSFWLSFNLED